MRYLLRLLVSVAVLVPLASVAGAQEPSERPSSRRSRSAGRSSPSIIRPASLQIRSDQNNIVTLDVPASYARFDQVKVGDVVSITYYDRVSVRLKPAGEPPVDRVESQHDHDAGAGLASRRDASDPAGRHGHPRHLGSGNENRDLHHDRRPKIHAAGQ